MHQAVEPLESVACRSLRYPRKFCCRRFSGLCGSHNVSLLRLTSPRVLPSTGVTPLQQYYDPSDFLTPIPASSLVRLVRQYCLPWQSGEDLPRHCVALMTCRALRPRGCPTSLPKAQCRIVSSGEFNPSTIPDLGLTGLNHFSPKAYGLSPLCLRLPGMVTHTDPRLDTRCGGSPLPERHFQPLVTQRLVAHKFAPTTISRQAAGLDSPLDCGRDFVSRSNDVYGRTL